MELRFLVPAAAVTDCISAVTDLAACIVTFEGWYGLIGFRQEPHPDAARVAVALVLGEVAKGYKDFLLVCDPVDGSTEEALRYISDEHGLKMNIFRFIWISADRDEMAVVRALMPNDPVLDPRVLWQEIEDGRARN